MPPDTNPLDDLERLRLPTGTAKPVTTSVRRRPPRHRRGERFLKGPIQWAWLERAGRLPGKALHVGLALWQSAGLQCGDTVKFSSSRLDSEMGVKRDAARRGLDALEQAGLVKVERHPGRMALVTILSVQASGGGDRA